MIKYADAQLAFARAVYDLLSESEEGEWFSIDQITKKAALNVGSAFVGRIMTLSGEEGDDIFNSLEENGQLWWTLGKDGFDLIEVSQAVSIDAEDVAPASDRVVRFNHNAPDAEEIAKQLTEVRESIRGANGPEIDEQERERVYGALIIAQEIWQSANFRLIQLKVGVLMAVEDAAALLVKTAKHVAAALLVDAIKSFVKNHFQTDLDAI